MAVDTETREQVGTILDALLGDQNGHGGKLMGAIREQLEPQLATAIEPVMGEIEALKAAQEQGPPQASKQAGYPLPPWATGSNQIMARMGLPDVNWYNPEAAGAVLDGKFESFGDFLRSVISAGRPNGRIDERLQLVTTNGDIQAALTGEEVELGGALVPEEFRPQLLSLMLQATSIRSRAMVLPLGASSVTIPAIRDVSHAGDNVFGGVSFHWLEVNDEIDESEPDFKLVQLTARGLAGRTILPNTLIEDSFLSVPTLIMSLWSQAVPWIEESVFIRGDGVGKPLGILNSPAVATISREAASKISVNDIAKMEAALLPGSAGRAVWMVNPQAWPELYTLNNSDAQVFHPALPGAVPTTLNGRPIITNEHLSGLGEVGDLVLVDWMYYLIGDRMTLSMDSSPHEKFSSNRTVLRGIERLDGRPWLDSPVTPAQRSGTDFVQSPFVVLGSA